MRIELLVLTVFVCLSCKRKLAEPPTTRLKENRISVAVDTSLAYKFEDYKVKLYKGKKAKVDIEKQPIAKKHWLAFYPPTSTRDLAFAGHFAVHKFQHSFGSVGGIIVDLKNGEVFEFPGCQFGYSYKKDSRLLVVNPPSIQERPNGCLNCETRYYIWTDSSASFVELPK